MTPIPFDPERLKRYQALTFERGKHGPDEDKFCTMEAYAMLAGETHSDHATCVCSVIGAAVRRFNDRVLDAGRRTKLLKDLAFVVIGSRSTPEVERRRSWMAADWSFRVATPRLLRTAPALAPWADKLEALPPIVDDKSLTAARQTLWAARDAAWGERNRIWGKLTAAAAAAAAADAAAVAVADAVAAADAAAVAVADAVAAADAAAVADAVANPKGLKAIIAAAQKAKAAGGGWSAQYDAARAVADKVFVNSPVRTRFLELRGELDAEFVALIRRMTEVKP